MAFITNYIEDKAMGYLATGLTAVGGMAGNAVGGVGSLIESSGRAVGNGEVLFSVLSAYLTKHSQVWKVSFAKAVTGSMAMGRA